MDPSNRRILIVDDNASIHDDFRKILARREADQRALVAAEAALFDDAPAAPAVDTDLGLFALDFALQGDEAVERVRRARAEHAPFAVAFVDMRMPPGIDGVSAIEGIWAVDPDVQVVVCTAFSDHSWPEVVQRLGRTDRLLILKKPFDSIEVCQLATALTEKWNATARERENLAAAVRAEGEARAYAASLELTNNAIEASWRRTEAELVARRRLMLDIADSVLVPTLTVLTQQLATLAPHRGSAPAESLDHALERSTELARTIQTLVELAQLDGGRDVALRVACSPRALADEIAARARKTAEGKPIDVLYQCAPALPATVQTVPERVQRVLGELIENAVRHTERGKVTLEVDLQEAAEGEEPMLRFAVTDTGRGIPDSAVNSLFEPFCKTESSGSSAHAGLGLAMCGRLAGSIGANLRFVRPAQGGTTFELFLPTH